LEARLHPEVEKSSQAPAAPDPELRPDSVRFEPYPPDIVERLLLGPQGLRAGWSILLFAGAFYFFRLMIQNVFFAAGIIRETNIESPIFVSLAELTAFLALLGAAAVTALIEGRRILDYNLSGPHRWRHLVSGCVAGFAALSLLVGVLAWGGWLTFGAVSLSGGRVLHFAVLWGCAFLLVGMVEEGLFRCYALFTVARGINFWWALAAQISICLYALLSHGGHGVYGVYAAAGLGLVPCLILHRRSGVRSAFWQAAWVTSTFFGLYHTANGGENWIGIFAAAFIGFVFCVSVRVTGSAWWAIACHAAWDWAETFFYGTADSGLRGQGHLLTASPSGNPIWTGGADGPEGSVLVLGVILLLLLFLLAAYGRSKLRVNSPPPTGTTAA
jgi:hypothetical protein